VGNSQWLIECSDPFGRYRAMTVLARPDEVVVVAPPGESAVLSVQQIRDLDRALAGAAANTGWPVAVS
jgi:hypothetical protein